MGRKIGKKAQEYLGLMKVLGRSFTDRLECPCVVARHKK